MRASASCWRVLASSQVRAVRVARSAAGGVVVHEVPQEALGRVIELVEKYGDLPMDLADATLVVAAEVLGVREIVSIDRDFGVYRIGGRASFENLYPGRWSDEPRG